MLRTQIVEAVTHGDDAKLAKLYEGVRSFVQQNPEHASRIPPVLRKHANASTPVKDIVLPD